jgi:hypothetical protein
LKSNIINLSIQIYACKTQLDLSGVRLNNHLSSRLGRLKPFTSVVLGRLDRLLPFFDHLNGQPFNFHLPPKQNSLPPFSGRLNSLGRLGEH